MYTLCAQCEWCTHAYELRDVHIIQTPGPRSDVRTHTYTINAVSSSRFLAVYAPCSRVPTHVHRRGNKVCTQVCECVEQWRTQGEISNSCLASTGWHRDLQPNPLTEPPAPCKANTASLTIRWKIRVNKNQQISFEHRYVRSYSSHVTAVFKDPVAVFCTHTRSSSVAVREW